MRKSTEYCIKRNKLINEKLKKYYDKEEESILLFYKDLNDIKLIFKALDRLGYKWRSGDYLLNYDKLERFYDKSIKISGSFCIIIDDEKYYDSCNIGLWSNYYEDYCQELGKISDIPAKEIVRILINIYEKLRQ